jgi:hypothetical protein
MAGARILEMKPASCLVVACQRTTEAKRKLRRLPRVDVPRSTTPQIGFEAATVVSAELRLCLSCQTVVLLGFEMDQHGLLSADGKPLQKPRSTAHRNFVSASRYAKVLRITTSNSPIARVLIMFTI